LIIAKSSFRKVENKYALQFGYYTMQFHDFKVIRSLPKDLFQTHNAASGNVLERFWDDMLSIRAEPREIGRKALRISRDYPQNPA
jgi:hypothetical protein